MPRSGRFARPSASLSSSLTESAGQSATARFGDRSSRCLPLRAIAWIWTVVLDRAGVLRLRVQCLIRIDTALRGHVRERIAVGLQHCVDAQVHHAAQDDVAKSWADFATV